MAGTPPSFWDYLDTNSARLLELTQEHLLLTLSALGLGTVLGVALGVLAYRRPRLRGPILGTTGLILTIPSLALYALLVGVLGLGWLPVVVALTLYSLLPIVRNTVAGLVGVDSAIVEAAQGQGMGPWRRLALIQMPMAWPVILTGVRVSAIIVVGIAALGAIVNGPGWASCSSKVCAGSAARSLSTWPWPAPSASSCSAPCSTRRSSPGSPHHTEGHPWLET
jgi:osmoprotectant transport system permease protein